MRRHRFVLVLASAAAAWCAAPMAVAGAATASGSGPATFSATGSWGQAITLPGLPRLNVDGEGQVYSVSCASTGNCAAGGIYADGALHMQAFVASEVNGRWRQAIEVPGTATLNAGTGAYVNSVSCGAAGNCAAGGVYTDSSHHGQAFVASEVNGQWQTAIEVPGTATLNAGGNAGVASVSCGAGGNCVAGGSYRDVSGHNQAFVASEVSGKWRKAIEVPGTATLNAGPNASVSSVSCGSPGNCVAGGGYTDGSGHGQAFVASEVKGVWQAAIKLPGSAKLNAGGSAGVYSVSCASAGNCAAGGQYKDGSAHLQAFVASEVNGRWRQAIEVPGSATLNAGGNDAVDSVSCGSAGNCAAGGSYRDGSGHGQTFVASEVNGQWRAAIKLPGSGKLNAGGDANLFSVSCASAGNCVAGGFYSDGSGHAQALVASEVSGTWRAAIEVPGTATLNANGNAWTNGVSCAPAGKCVAGGFYADSSNHLQAFAVSQT